MVRKRFIEVLRRPCANERGQVLIESALIIPMLLLITVGIFEFGRALQTWQVLTNAAREGARMSVLATADEDTVEARVVQYMTMGRLPAAASAEVTVDREATFTVNGETVGASEITVEYPFDFMVLNPVAQLFVADTNLGDSFTMTATAVMRNEAQ